MGRYRCHVVWLCDFSVVIAVLVASRRRVDLRPSLFEYYRRAELAGPEKVRVDKDSNSTLLGLWMVLAGIFGALFAIVPDLPGPLWWFCVACSGAAFSNYTAHAVLAQLRTEWFTSTWVTNSLWFTVFVTWVIGFGSLKYLALLGARFSAWSAGIPIPAMSFG